MEAALRPVGRQVRMVIGSGAYAMVYPRSPQMIDSVLDALHMSLKGVEIYTSDSIPEHLHWAHSKYCPPILVLAHPGTVIMRASGQHQRPAPVFDQATTRLFHTGNKPGISGYDPEEPDMRGVFMARGPGKLFICDNDASLHRGATRVYLRNGRTKIGDGRLIFGQLVAPFPFIVAILNIK